MPRLIEVARPGDIFQFFLIGPSPALCAGHLAVDLVKGFRLWPVEWKTGLSKWPILYRSIAAQFCRFGLAALAYDSFRFVSCPFFTM